MTLKIEIGQYRLINSGSLRASFTLIIHPFGQKILQCKHFVTEKGSWWNMPAFEVKSKELMGKSEYIPLISYLDKEYNAQLKNAVLEALKDVKPLENHGKETKAPRQENPLQGDSPELPF